MWESLRKSTAGFRFDSHVMHKHGRIDRLPQPHTDRPPPTHPQRSEEQMNSDNLSTRRQQTRATLVEAGISVFAVKGIDGASIEEICEAAGFTRGAFYSNFSSRDDLVLATVEQRTSEALDRLDRTIEKWRGELDSVASEGIESLLNRFISDIFSEKGSTVADTITEHEIELYCVRVPGLYARFDEYNSHQTERLIALVQTAMDIVGARSTIPMPNLLVILMAIYSKLALEASAGKDLHEHIMIDPAPMTQILLVFLEFPDSTQCSDE